MIYTLTDIQAFVKRQFDSLDWNIQPRGLYAPIEYVLSMGGKRLRPMLTFLSANLFTEDLTATIPAAEALEIFHNFTLLHDDIMDKAPVRRGKPTVHVKWNDSAAILSGDAMLVKAYEKFALIPQDKLPLCLPVFTRTALEVCEGQQYDMDFETRDDVTENQYMEMIRLKTAVLLAACLKIGALVNNSSAQDADLLYRFGINLGLAFQLKDDLLDVYGNPETFGKQIGGDISCNKKTFLLINALSAASLEQRRQLQHWISISQLHDEKIKAVTELYNQIGVRALCEDRIQSLSDEAVKLLQGVSVPAVRKQSLLSLAAKLTKREL